MDELTLITKIQRELKEQYQQIGDAMISGSVDNMEKYKYMMGQAHAYYKISQDISNLLNNSENPKIKYALADKYEEENKKIEDKEQKTYERLKTKESDKLPQPTGWRMLLLPFKMKEKTKGGLILGQETLEKQQVASQCGLVLAMGPHCYDKEKFPEGPWCKKGDWVVFARYAGSRIQIDGGEVRLLNDDEVLATIDNPEDILHQY
jgi:chaperonin GroES